MTTFQLVRRGLRYYWRTNLAVVLGAATAVAVLGGALLVGDSVRGSLRDLVLQRLGRTDQVVASATFFQGRLADAIRSHSSFESIFSGIAPLIVTEGTVTDQDTGRRAGDVRVYGVDDRFWRFHGLSEMTGPFDGDAFVSQALARETGTRAGNAMIARTPRPSDIPLESLHGRKEDLGSSLRVTVRAVVPSAMLGEFSLQAQQEDVRALFVPLSRLQQEFQLADRVNTLLISTRPERRGDAAPALEQIVRSQATLEDVGLTIKTLDERQAIVVDSRAGLVDDTWATAVTETLTEAGMRAQPVFTNLATALHRGDRQIPYSLVTAIDLSAIAPRVPSVPEAATPSIVLNEWAARDLQAAVGDPITMEYFVWEEPGLLSTRTTQFRVGAVVPVDAGDPDLTPVYPGISDSPSLVDWDPPFPIDLRRIRPADEEYWDRYGTTPKAFVPLEVGQRLWRSRFGAVTSIRATASPSRSLGETRAEVEQRLRARINPLTAGLAVRDVRTAALEAARGATDFGRYFVYFSFFLVVSALLLVALFFKLGVEQRAREVGLLRAVGLQPAAVRRLFLGEGLLLAIIGSVVGTVGAVAYASLIMKALATWWIGAVGTAALTLHVTWTSLVVGAIGGTAAALGCIWWTLRGFTPVSERSLLAGQIEPPGPETQTAGANRGGGSWPRQLVGAIALAVTGAALMAGGVAGTLDRTGAFFGAGAALLAASMCFFGVGLRRPFQHVVAGRGWLPLSRLGLRNTTHRPARSVLSTAVIASATFILISVDAFRRDGAVATEDMRSGVGGYQLLVESVLPIVHDPNSLEGRRTLNLSNLDDSVRIEPFRLLPGDDASCLNLYAPEKPRILAPTDSFLAEGRFRFQDSRASTDAERANPWLLLNRREPDGAIPVIADANSMTYVLHRRLGEDIVFMHGAREIRLRLVGALRDSIFQRELLMSQTSFLTHFPEQEGYRLLLVETAPANAPAVLTEIEAALSDLGADATGTAEWLAAFHRVENTYLSTFQALGGLGLLLGTVGMAAVLIRNVLERRRELALLRAVGYRRGHFQVMLMAENGLLLIAGLVAGALSASLAIAPAIVERGGRMPLTSIGGLMLFAVLLTGLVSSIIATRAALSGPLLESLRSE